MQATEENLDRSKWGSGPWDAEPDRVDFEHAGLPCLVLRVRDLGHLCGYVAVPPGHPLHGVKYNENAPALEVALARRKEEPIGANPGMGVLLALLSGEVEARPDVALSVHGGLTYSGKCSGRICHVAQPGAPDDVWWFGFDCAHCDDLSPYMNGRGYGFRDAGATYRDVDYVRRECERLAEQLKEIS